MSVGCSCSPAGGGRRGSWRRQLRPHEQAVAGSLAMNDAGSAAARPPVVASRTVRDLLIVAGLSVLVGALWITTIPSFEGPDELFFYNRARQLAAAPERRENVYFRLAGPIIRAMSPDAGLPQPRYNPAFQFVGNQRGEVNRFVLDHSVAPREHVRTLLALRALTALLAAATMTIVYVIALLSLGDRRRALLVAAICICIPQSSFVNAVVHPEAATRLLAAAVTLVVVAGATRRAPRWLVWSALLTGIALVPFADRQALFLAPWAALSLIAIERSWKGRAAAAAAIVVPVVMAAVILTRYTEAGTDFGPWLQAARHPLRPLFAADPGRGTTPPDVPYYVFEFLPKLFTGFWGWLGQPSLLLPAWQFAAVAVLAILAAVGTLTPARRSISIADDPDRRRARVLQAIGVGLMMLPIVYGPSVAGRDLWDGRWLFAMLGPLTIGFVLGLERFTSFARDHARPVATALACTAAAAIALWFAPPGAALRTAIATHHYGDVARFVDVTRDLLVVLALVAVAVAVAAKWPAITRISIPTLVVAVVAANVATVAAVVRPLYAPMTPSEYDAQVRNYLAAGKTSAAADLYASAVASYPESVELRTLGDAAPRLLVSRSDASSLTRLWSRIARGQSIDDPDSLFMLAYEASGNPSAAAWRESDAVAVALQHAEQRQDLAEPAALLRLAVEGGGSAPDAATRPITAGGGIRIGARLRNGELIVEGVTHRPSAAVGTQVIVYFTPHVDATSRRLWLHAYRVADRRQYLDVVPTLAPVIWKPGLLAWASFELPAGRYDTYVGLWVGYDIGPGQPLGVMPS